LAAGLSPDPLGELPALFQIPTALRGAQGRGRESGEAKGRKKDWERKKEEGEVKKGKGAYSC